MFKKLALIAVTATIASASTAQAAPTAWDMPAGDNGTYTYSNGQNSTNSLETGTAFSGGFFFLPASFEAHTPGGSSGTFNSDADVASVILNAKPNQRFTSISAGILGDYTIDNGGSVDTQSFLRVINLDTSALLATPLTGSTTPIVSTSSSDGIFSQSTVLNLPDGWRNIRVELDASVFTASMTGSTLIQIKDGEIGVSTAEIPIPAAVAVAPVAAAIYGWRKRRQGAARGAAR